MGSTKNRPQPDRQEQQQTISGQNNNQYQAVGDIHIHPLTPKGPEKGKWLSTTQTVLSIVSLIVTTFIALCITVPEKLNWRFGLQKETKADTIPVQVLTGIVKDFVTQEPITSAQVIIDFPSTDTTITTSDGTFEFPIRCRQAAPVHVRVFAKNYRNVSINHIIGTAVEIQMKQK